MLILMKDIYLELTVSNNTDKENLGSTLQPKDQTLSQECSE